MNLNALKFTEIEVDKLKGNNSTRYGVYDCFKKKVLRRMGVLHLSLCNEVARLHSICKCIVLHNYDVFTRLFWR